MKSRPKTIDFHEHVSLHVNILQTTGLWFYIPHPKTSARFWLHIIIRILYGLLVFTLPPLAQIAHVVKMLASENFEIHDIASSINLILTEILVSLKLLDLYCRRGLLTQLMDQLSTGDFHRHTHRTLLEKAIKLSLRLFWCLLAGSSLDVFFHMVVVPGLGRFQSLPVKMDLIFIDINEAPYFDYMCFYQIMYKPTVVLTYIAIQTLPWSLLLFAIAQLDILIDNFKHMALLAKEIKADKQCVEDQALNEVFKNLVHHHRAIIRFLDTAEAAFGGQFALTLILSSCVICFTGVQFLSIETPSKNLVAVFWVMAYLQIFVLIMFTDCYFGNSVYVKSTDLATVAYGIPWLSMPQDLKKNLVLVIARAQKPLVITAYKLVPISLPTFTKVPPWQTIRFGIGILFTDRLCAFHREIRSVWKLAVGSPTMSAVFGSVMNWTYKAFAVMNGMK